MRWKKIVTTLFLGLLCAVFLNGQSLYELAQKEKERRAKLQGKTSLVVTNDDLRSSAKAASIRVTTPPAAKRQPQPPTSSSPSPNPRVVTSRADRQRIQGEATESNLQQVQGLASRSRLKYATEVLGSTRLVNNPDWALRKPDRQYAEIKLSGILDLSLTAQNGPGADIAVFARPSAAGEGATEDQDEGGVSAAATFGMVEGFWYGVFAMNKDGEWIALGKGAGANSPEGFDLGDISSTTRIRIIFNPNNNPNLPYNRVRNTPQESTFGIDAVSVLH